MLGVSVQLSCLLGWVIFAIGAATSLGLVTLLLCCGLFKLSIHLSELKGDKNDDVVYVHHIGKGPRAPSISNFPLKLEAFLKLAKIPYKVVYSLKMSKKGKIPFITHRNKEIADSNMCIDYLMETFQVDIAGQPIEAALKSSQSVSHKSEAIGHFAQRMLEENTYWTMVHEMFFRDSHGFTDFKAKHLLPYKGWRLAIRAAVLKGVLKLELWGQGIGRHTDAELDTIAERDLQFLSNVLGKQKFFVEEDRITRYDCAIFAILAQMMYHMPDNTLHNRLLMEKYSNLTSFVERVKEQLWSTTIDQSILENQWSTSTL